MSKSDGMGHGTVMVKDIDPGPEDSVSPYSIVVSDTLYFEASDGEHGYELWKTDGTEAGTFIVMDINPSSGDSYPRDFQRIGSKLVFTAADGSHGWELWALELVPEAPSGPPPLVPEASTLLPMTGGCAGLATCLGSQFKALRRAGTEKR
jgi:ELWxxDGT repeat protein